jgi:hypothetical protein
MEARVETPSGGLSFLVTTEEAKNNIVSIRSLGKFQYLSQRNGPL